MSSLQSDRAKQEKDFKERTGGRGFAVAGEKSLSGVESTRSIATDVNRDAKELSRDSVHRMGDEAMRYGKGEKHEEKRHEKHERKMEHEHMMHAKHGRKHHSRKGERKAGGR